MDDNNSKPKELKQSQEVLAIIPREAGERYKMVILGKEGNAIKVGMVDPNNLESQDALRFILNRQGLKAEVYSISEKELQANLKKYKQSTSTIGEALKDIEKEQKKEKEKQPEAEGAGKLDEILESAPVAKIVDVVLENAIEGEASDIHIEPTEKDVKVRFRVDGVLHSSLFLPRHVAPLIVSRIKILANLKIDEKRKPQDGRFQTTHKGRSVDIRTSTLPVSDGEKVVMRVLDEGSDLLDLEGLGLWGRGRKLLEEEVKEPYGMTLITGPTGSGKSTTLYTAMSMMDREENNIVTLEDPVEYKIEGVNQSQIRPEIKFSFATGLRSILRQDPDIIMVGEIRDEETAELVVHASLTGHLVFSTLHTNNAVGAIPRMVDMKVEPFLLSSSLKMIMAQRLVRRICKNCIEAIKPGKRVEGIIRDALKRIPPEIKKEAGINESEITIYQGKGCDSCSNTGKKGRIAVFEVMKVTDNIKRVIEDGDIKGDSLWKEFYAQGAVTMREDGIIKVLQGLTTMEEVERATANTKEEDTEEKPEDEQLV